MLGEILPPLQKKKKKKRDKEAYSAGQKEMEESIDRASNL